MIQDILSSIVADTKTRDTETGDAVRRTRVARGISQLELARRAGMSRQALGAIESGAYQPGVTVALKLAHHLGESVERLFGGGGGMERLIAAWTESVRPSGSRLPVALGRVGGRLVAIAQPVAGLRLAPAAGMLEHAVRGRAEVMALRSREEIDSTLLIAGCDPAVTLLADWLARRRSAVSGVALRCSSREALGALLEGRAHAAGLHLRDPQTGEYNLRPARLAMGRRRALLVNFARWELGLATSPGKRLQIRGWADLARPGIEIVNRERGSGARAALDEALAALRLGANRIGGYKREVRGHLEVAAAVAAGQADVGVTIRVAAEAYELGFVALREEGYDLVIPESEANAAPVKAMLEALNSSRFGNELAELCAYDTSRMGNVVARFG
jgi:putative molybdopterin biosynthesis protein